MVTCILVGVVLRGVFRVFIFGVFRLYTTSLGCILNFTGLCSS